MPSCSASRAALVLTGDTGAPNRPSLDPRVRFIFDENSRNRALSRDDNNLPPLDPTGDRNPTWRSRVGPDASVGDPRATFLENFFFSFGVESPTRARSAFVDKAFVRSSVAKAFFSSAKAFATAASRFAACSRFARFAATRVACAAATAAASSPPRFPQSPVPVFA